MRNYVAKHDYNRASAHRDKKNDYTRNWNIEEELNDYNRTMGRDLDESETDGSEESYQ
ncbi:hypothetical protein EBOKLHFM_00178 [Klebsiella phage KP13-26]|nr:hypothetical protein EBOKLHFM_00178 [Klebsiella phage KP13-26]